MSEEELLEKVIAFRVPTSDKTFEMTDCPRDKHDDRFFFTIGDIDEAKQQVVQLTTRAYAREIQKYGLLDCIENLFHETFGEGHALPMRNTFFWILYHTNMINCPQSTKKKQGGGGD